MDNASLNSAIAKRLGWKELRFESKTNGVYSMWSDNGTYHELPPNYTADLNACHSAWLTLDRLARLSYSQILREVVVRGGGFASALEADIVACVENATAAQRAEALARTWGIWRE